MNIEQFTNEYYEMVSTISPKFEIKISKIIKTKAHSSTRSSFKVHRFNNHVKFNCQSLKNQSMHNRNVSFNLSRNSSLKTHFMKQKQINSTIKAVFYNKKKNEIQKNNYHNQQSLKNYPIKNLLDNFKKISHLNRTKKIILEHLTPTSQNAKRILIFGNNLSHNSPIKKMETLNNINKYSINNNVSPRLKPYLKMKNFLRDKAKKTIIFPLIKH